MTYDTILLVVTEFSASVWVEVRVIGQGDLASDCFVELSRVRGS